MKRRRGPSTTTPVTQSRDRAHVGQNRHDAVLARRDEKLREQLLARMKP